ILIYPWDKPGGLYIYKRDLQFLQPDAKLNDGVLEFGLRSARVFHCIGDCWRALYESVYVFSSFFYSKLSEKICRGFEDVKGWTAGVDIFKKKYLLMPIHERSHWFLVLIEEPGWMLSDGPAMDDLLDDQCTAIYTLDSMGYDHADVMSIVSGYLKKEALHKLGVGTKGVAVQMKLKVAVPKQANGLDCGLYVLHFAKTLLEDVDGFHGVVRAAGVRMLFYH
ncbi:cysteine proteinase, partial [Hymenopellis radicata]